MNMKKTLLALFLIFSLFPISTSFSQKTDTESTFAIVLTSNSPYNYKDEDGTTVILGEVENTKNFPITGVTIFAAFYDDISEQPIETIRGTTILDVILPFSNSPYMIKSPTPNSAITSVSINLLGFNSASPKQESLSIKQDSFIVGKQVTFSGSITNNGELTSDDTKVHLVFFDAFRPPRILGISSITIDEEIPAGSSANFDFNTKYDSRAVRVNVFAESNNYLANVLDLPFSAPDVLTKLVTINDISITDTEGNRLPDVPVDSTVNIQSRIWIQYSADQASPEQPYIYYIQIKQSGEKAFVEFIGKAEGAFETGGTKIPSVEWKPQNTGLYFVETFVWDPNAVPLASKGPIALILVT